MPPSKIGDIDEFNAGPPFDRGDRLVAEKSIGTAEVEHEFGAGGLTAASLMRDFADGFLYDPYHSN